MKTEWREFLSGNGAEFDDCDKVISFGNPSREVRAALNGNVFADLSHSGMIAVHGKDAEAFLQGQFSNDVKQLDSHTGQLGSYCNAKGRMIANFRMHQRGDTWYLRLPAELVETLLNKLRMFVLRSDVTLEDAGEAWIRMGSSGPEAAAEVETAIGRPAPRNIDEALEGDAWTVIRLPGIHPRFDIYATLDAARKIWDALNVRSAPVGAPAWDLLSIMAGVPTIMLATSELFVPQMANMQILGGVSFKKGCYPGQEVVARMQYLGKLKRRMYLIHMNTDSAPAPGDEIFTADNKEQSAGRIVNAAAHPDGGYTALGVIQIASAESGSLFLGPTEEIPVEMLELPYAFPAEEEMAED